MRGLQLELSASVSAIQVLLQESQSAADGIEVLEALPRIWVEQALEQTLCAAIPYSRQIHAESRLSYLGYSLDVKNEDKKGISKGLGSLKRSHACICMTLCALRRGGLSLFRPSCTPFCSLRGSQTCAACSRVQESLRIFKACSEHSSFMYSWHVKHFLSRLSNWAQEFLTKIQASLLLR